MQSVFKDLSISCSKNY